MTINFITKTNEGFDQGTITKILLLLIVPLHSHEGERQRGRESERALSVITYYMLCDDARRFH